MGIVLQFQSFPTVRRQSSLQFCGKIRPENDKTAEVVIFPGVRQERSFIQKDMQAAEADRIVSKLPAE